MKNVLSLLVVSIIILLNSSCALGLGTRKSCDPPVIPIRPQELFCIAGNNGTGQCFNPNTGKNEVKLIENYVCKHISQYNREQEWIDDVLRSVNQ